jgi:hypothetical protein
MSIAAVEHADEAVIVDRSIPRLLRDVAIFHPPRS